MADVHRRAVGSAPRMTPDEIANRGFASAFRGISETEVRTFLKRVADEVALTVRLDRWQVERLKGEGVKVEEAGSGAGMRRALGA